MFFQYLSVYIFCFLSVLILIFSGRAINFTFLKFNNNTIEDGLLGIIFLSFIALLINFFSSLNSYLNTFVLLFLLYPLFFCSIKEIKKILKSSLIISLIGFVTFILDSSNRPDAGLYHLPYISMLNESKIVIGSVNLHFRFGHISILQYLSAIFNNNLFDENGILIPVTILYSFVLCFFTQEVFKRKNEKFIRFFSALICLWILVSMNRYSGFGNDDPTHFFYFITIFYLLKKNILEDDTKKFNKVLIFSLYTYMLKQFFILACFYPIYFLIKKYKKIKFNNLVSFFCCIFFLLWIGKNILVSSCGFYPVKITCFEGLKWYPHETLASPENASISGEAWAKGFGDRANKNISTKQFISNLDWTGVWFETHFQYILKKISLIFSIFFIIGTILLNTKRLTRPNFPIYDVAFLIGINFLFILIWFFKFPIYRYGAGYIAIFFILSFIYLFKHRYENLRFKAKFSNLIFCIIFISLIGVILKNTLRISKRFNNNYTNYPWPIKNSFDSKDNKKNSNIAITKNGKIIYYMPYPDILCMYSKSPCTHFGVRVKKNKIFNYYEVYYSQKKKIN